MAGATNGNGYSRVDGPAKVKGEAKYAGEYQAKDLCYGVVVNSAVARGKIVAINTSKALDVEGVLQVFTHENRPHLPLFDRNYKDQDQPPGSPFRPLYDNKILFNMQPVALVVARTFELARYASGLVHITYEEKKPAADFMKRLHRAYDPKTGKSDWKRPKSKGDAEKIVAGAEHKIETSYLHGAEHHNPLEMHATTVVYEHDGSLTVYDKTQGVQNCQKYLTKVFGLKEKEVRVKSLFVGGAFGSALRPQYQLFMATMAALELKRPVRVTLTRQQMFSFGHRPATFQKISIAAEPDGKIQAIVHEAIQETSRFEDYTENVVNWSPAMYHIENFALSYKLLQLDTYTPLDMRAPGGATGVYAIEAAMDEMAYALHMDPLQFRLVNYAEKDTIQDKPYSSKALRECYSQGAEKFGWNNRPVAPRSMRSGNLLVGWGMATGIWEAQQKPARAKASFTVDGHLTVSSATSDIGTGTYTVMTQIAAEAMGLPIENVDFLLGDSILPLAPLEGGSWTVSAVGSAVKKVCEKIRDQLFTHARKQTDSPFADMSEKEVMFQDGYIVLKSDPAVRKSYREIMLAEKINYLEDDVTSLPEPAQLFYSRYTHSAVFVEVKVDEEIGKVSVSKVVIAVAAGRIINPKTARSQVEGGVVWGIGMALEEESLMDPELGRFMNHDLAEYHVPVNADICDMEMIFVEEQDDVVNPLGAKGVGEIGIVGVAAAVVNAVFHATGKRIREIPVTMDKVIETAVEIAPV